MNKKIQTITYAAIIAALYAACSLLPGINAISYGPIQFRISEALMLTCLFSPAGVGGVVAGCFIANLFSPFVNPLDICFGTLATLLAALTTYFMRGFFLRHKWLAPLPTILFNSIIVGSYLPFLGFDLSIFPVTAPLGLWLCVAASVAAGEAVVCYVLGIPLSILFEKHNLLKSA